MPYANWMQSVCHFVRSVATYCSSLALPSSPFSLQHTFHISANTFLHSLLLTPYLVIKMALLNLHKASSNSAVCDAAAAAAVARRA